MLDFGDAGLDITDYVGTLQKLEATKKELPTARAEKEGMTPRPPRDNPNTEGRTSAILRAFASRKKLVSTAQFWVSMRSKPGLARSACDKGRYFSTQYHTYRQTEGTTAVTAKVGENWFTLLEHHVMFVGMMKSASSR